MAGTRDRHDAMAMVFDLAVAAMLAAFLALSAIGVAF
jgi:hypothetical protein